MTERFVPLCCVAEVTGVNKDVIRGLVRAGKVKSYKWEERGHRRYLASEVFEALREAGAQDAPSDPWAIAQQAI